MKPTKRLKKEKIMQAKKKGFIPFAKKNDTAVPKIEAPKMAGLDSLKGKFTSALKSQRTKV